MYQAFCIPDTFCKMTPLAFCSQPDIILSPLLPVVLTMSVLQCFSLSAEMHNTMHVPGQAPELPCPVALTHTVYPEHQVCVSHTSWISQTESQGTTLRVLPQ